MSGPTAGDPGDSNSLGGYLATLTEIIIVVLAVVQILSGTLAMMEAWEAVALVYLAAGFVLTWVRSGSAVHGLPRVGILDTLSWVLPIAASAAGVNSAVLLLERAAADDVPGPLFHLVASVGIITSWALLQAGFANVYENVHERAGRSALAFPETPRPGRVEYLYLAFTVGTSFATSDVVICSPRARLVVLLHSVLGFLYNALVVAVAFQVLQSLVHQ